MTRTIADLIEDRFGLPTAAGRAVPAEGTVAQLLSHRVQRRYKPDPISDETLEIVLAAALSAPSKSDLQQVAIVIVRDRAKQATVGGWIPDMPWIATAPLFLIFCGDHRRMRRIAELRGRPFPNDTLDMFMNAAVDAGLVLQNFVMAAEAMGLGCCPISVVRNHVEKLSEMLELPPAVFPVAGLTVGYPAQPGWISTRTATTTVSFPPSWTPTTAGARPGSRRRPTSSASRIVSASPSPTAGRRTRRGSTPCPSATTSGRSSVATGSVWPDDRESPAYRLNANSRLRRPAPRTAP
jgi:nitroreductase